MMTLYSGITDPFSHRCRIVLYEKGMDFEIIDVDLMNKPEDLAVMNPYNRTPGPGRTGPGALRVEHHQRVHRRALSRIRSSCPRTRSCARARGSSCSASSRSSSTTCRRWNRAPRRRRSKARLYIRENLIQIAPIFVKQKYMLGEEFSMLDVAIAPLLWRLDHYQIQLNKQSAPLLKYAERLFSRQAFIDSMTASEKAMRR